MVPLWQKKSVWQVTTIIQPALCHLVTSHFQEIACNWTPKDQIRWPIFLMLLCMIVLTEKTSKFPQPIIFWILVFSCHKMTLITKITWMPHRELPTQTPPGHESRLRPCFTFLSFRLTTFAGPQNTAAHLDSRVIAIIYILIPLLLGNRGYTSLPSLNLG